MLILGIVGLVIATLLALAILIFLVLYEFKRSRRVKNRRPPIS